MREREGGREGGGEGGRGRRREGGEGGREGRERGGGGIGGQKGELEAVLYYMSVLAL